MAKGNRADEGDAVQAGYALGDLDILPRGRISQTQPIAAPRMPANEQRADEKRAPRDLTLADDDDLGPALELDVEPAPVRGAGRASLSAPLPLPANDVLAGFGTAALDDDLDSLAALPSLDVEQPVARPSAPRPARKESAPEDPKRKQAEEHKRTLALADFGDTPRGLISSARYAVHVTRRLLSLRRERGRVQLDLQRANGEHRDALVAMGRALLAIAGDKRCEPLRTCFAKVSDEQGKVQQASVSVERTREENQRALATLEGEAATLREQLEPYLAREKAAEAAHKKAQDDERRAQAMLKRVEIELRALAEASTPSDPARVEALHAQLAQRREALAQLAEPLAKATEQLGQARRELALARGSLDALEEKKKRLEGSLRTREVEVEGQREQADGALQAALRQLAETAHGQLLSGLVPREAQRVAECELALGEASETLARFDRALTLYHRPSVVRGYLLLTAVLLGLLGVLVLR